MSAHPILTVTPFGFPWQTDDPFLFCVHHDDAYPSGNELMGPTAALAGRNIGADFSGKDGWSMYHGDVVPDFPSIPIGGSKPSPSRDGGSSIIRTRSARPRDSVAGTPSG